eukprot:CAMPEP_0115360496 /NCGR_PEP_ID=MMETSP0270-20121206/101716_1 /TAXON_ID=71861 /ORGANISM="Scrippsiella trochoidea, Strain CCMP3099" /LENGTH=52 /DNA_ID=CAMNT_0002783031 /DNA_START=84 /DNA_END=239 /DNA_ORIENTATION=+
MTEITVEFNSVERVFEYVNELPREAPAYVEGRRPPPDWPAAGVLELKDLKLR